MPSSATPPSLTLHEDGQAFNSQNPLGITLEEDHISWVSPRIVPDDTPQPPQSTGACDEPPNDEGRPSDDAQEAAPFLSDEAESVFDFGVDPSESVAVASTVDSANADPFEYVASPTVSFSFSPSLPSLGQGAAADAVARTLVDVTPNEPLSTAIEDFLFSFLDSVPNEGDDASRYAPASEQCAPTDNPVQPRQQAFLDTVLPRHISWPQDEYGYGLQQPSALSETAFQAPKRLTLTMASAVESRAEKLGPPDAPSWPMADLYADYTAPIAVEEGPPPVTMVEVSPDDTAAAEAVDVSVLSYGRLIFADGVFHINTHNLIIGRDQAAIAQARRAVASVEKTVEAAYPNGSDEQKALLRSELLAPYNGKFYSSEGGLMGPAQNSAEARWRKAASCVSSVRSVPGNDVGGDAEDAEAAAMADAADAAEAAAMAAAADTAEAGHGATDTEGADGPAAPVDIVGLMPPPKQVAFVRIHSPGTVVEMLERTKAISRQHVQICYNSQTGVFEASPLHRNGFFVDDVHHVKGPVPLKSGDRLQIKDVICTLQFPHPRRKTSNDQNGLDGRAAATAPDRSTSRAAARGGKEMSFDFEHNSDSANARDTSENDEDDARIDPAYPGVLANLSSGPDLTAMAKGGQMDATTSGSFTPVRDLSALPMPLPMPAGNGMAALSGPAPAATTSPSGAPPATTAEEDARNAAIDEQLNVCSTIMDRYRQRTAEAQPKKRGPGRPPKNGLFSIREMKACLEDGNLTPEEETILQKTIQSMRQKHKKKDKAPDSARQQPDAAALQAQQHAQQVQQAQQMQQIHQAQAHQAQHSQQSQQAQLAQQDLSMDLQAQQLQQLQAAAQASLPPMSEADLAQSMTQQNLESLIAFGQNVDGDRRPSQENLHQDQFATMGPTGDAVASEEQDMANRLLQAIGRGSEGTMSGQPMDAGALLPGSPSDTPGAVPAIDASSVHGTPDAHGDVLNGTPFSTPGGTTVAGTPGFFDAAAAGALPGGTGAMGPDGVTPMKRKVGRPRKHPLQDGEGNDDRLEKRRYKPRRKSGDDNAMGLGSFASLGDGVAGHGLMRPDGSFNAGVGPANGGGNGAAQQKRPERHKTPPLVLNRSQFTETQVAKPNKNYSVLIDEVLTDVSPHGLHLKQIYKRIQENYPFYYFTVETKGWESSVRHNLIGNEAFRKDEATGLWHRVMGVELDAGKKRKGGNSPEHTNTNPFQNYAASWGQQQAQPQVAQDNNGNPLQTMYHGNIAMMVPPPQPSAMVYQPQAGAGTQTAVNGNVLMTTGNVAVPGLAASQSAPPGPSTLAATTNGHVAAAGAYAPTAPGAQGPGGAAATGAAWPVAGQHPLAGSAGTAAATAVSAPAAAPVSAAPASAAAGAEQSSSSTPASNQPVVSDELMRLVQHFKTQVDQQAGALLEHTERTALIVVNRGLGLSETRYTQNEQLDGVLFKVFQRAREQMRADIDPALLSLLLAFKEKFQTIVSQLLGDRSEALILSAINRALGFTDRSMVPVRPEDVQTEIAAAEALILDEAIRLVSAFQAPRS